MNKNEYIEFWDGQLFELLTLDKEVFFTQLIQHEPALFIQRPVNEKNVPLVVENGMPITVYFHNDAKGLYTFNTNIYIFPNKALFIKNPATNTIKKAQRRLYFRVQVAVEMRILLSPNKKSNKVEDLTTFTHDISGGGVSFLSRQKVIEEGKIVHGILSFNNGDHLQKVEFKGKIVKVIKQGKELYRNALRFIDMGEAMRSEIIRFCLFKQIELRNKVMRDPSN